MESLTVAENNEIEMDVFYSIGEEEMYIVMVLEKPNSSVRFFLKKEHENLNNTDEIVEIGVYTFESIQIAREFYKKFKSMTAVDLIIFLHEHK